jgi:hypothetical protein
LIFYQKSNQAMCSSPAIGALGEQHRHETDVMRLEIAARGSVDGESSTSSPRTSPEHWGPPKRKDRHHGGLSDLRWIVR